jgi:hypothetical protein
MTALINILAAVGFALVLVSAICGAPLLMIPALICMGVAVVLCGSGMVE